MDDGFNSGVEIKQKGKSILRAHNLANTDVAAAARAWQMPALTKPGGCTD